MTKPLHAIFWLVVLCGCQTYDQAQGQPALLIDRSSAAQQELQAAISHRLPGTTVIAEDIFARSPSAVFDIGFAKKHGAAQALLPPVRVQLMRRSGECYLLLDEPAEVKLQHVRCQPLQGQ